MTAVAEFPVSRVASRRSVRIGHSVHKFGGAALADAASVRRTVALISGHGGVHRTGTPTVIVGSAIAGATDALIAIAGLATTAAPSVVEAEIRRLAHRHFDIIDGVLEGEVARATRDYAAHAFDELSVLTNAVRVAGGLSRRDRDVIVARGERIAVRLLAAALVQAGVAAEVVDATLLIHTSGRHGEAAPELAATVAATRNVLRPVLERGALPIVPGFIGRGEHGDTVTLGRGGSDLTATLLARALSAGEVVLWKDIAGLLTGDPRAVPNARVIPHLGLREAAELAHYGIQVLHPRALVPLTERTRLYVRGFELPAVPGTEISARIAHGESPVKAVVATMDQTLVSVVGEGLSPLPGIVARTFSALHDAGLSITLIAQAATEYSVAFTMPSAHAGAAASVLRRCFAAELARGEVLAVDARVGVATVGLVGVGLASQPGVAARAFGALAAARINVVATAQGSGTGGSLSIVVDATRAVEAQHALHEHFQLHKNGGGRIATEPVVDVVLLGVGSIGRELLGQLASARSWSGRSIRVCGLVDRSGYVFEPRGLSPRRLLRFRDLKANGRRIADTAHGVAASAAEALEHMSTYALSHPIVVDATAAATSSLLSIALTRGWDLVLANKVPLAGDQSEADALEDLARRHGRRILQEATVGAGLPVIDTLRKLLEAGDTITSIEGCPSGTLGFLFGELGRGVSFSAALASAIAAGYTEPDSRVDLSGLDVARKALILARLIGFTGSLADVGVESLVPEQLRQCSHDEFLSRTEELDDVWARRQSTAFANGTVLRYRARVTKASISVGLVAVRSTDPLGALNGTDNQFAFATARYNAQPLVITGPGAGAAVTASGVYNDILRLAATRIA